MHITYLCFSRHKVTQRYRLGKRSLEVILVKPLCVYSQLKRGLFNELWSDEYRLLRLHLGCFPPPPKGQHLLNLWRWFLGSVLWIPKLTESEIKSISKRNDIMWTDTLHKNAVSLVVLCVPGIHGSWCFSLSNLGHFFLKLVLSCD